MGFKIGDEVVLQMSGIITGMNSDYADNKIRYTISGFNHCTSATVLEEHFKPKTVCCHQCAREFQENEMFLLPIANGPDDCDDEQVCRDCYDYAMAQSSE